MKENTLKTAAKILRMPEACAAQFITLLWRKPLGFQASGGLSELNFGSPCSSGISALWGLPCLKVQGVGGRFDKSEYLPNETCTGDLPCCRTMPR